MGADEGHRQRRERDTDMSYGSMLDDASIFIVQLLLPLHLLRTGNLSRPLKISLPPSLFVSRSLLLYSLETLLRIAIFE